MDDNSRCVPRRGPTILIVIFMLIVYIPLSSASPSAPTDDDSLYTYMYPGVDAASGEQVELSEHLLNSQQFSSRLWQEGPAELW